MKRIFLSNLCLAALALLVSPVSSMAFPPAPSHTIHGLVRDEYGVPLTVSNAQIIFSVEGVASSQVSGLITPNLEPGGNYRINLSMDSGTAPDLYKATALKPAAPFRIRVKIGNITYLPIEMTANFANLGKPAQSTRIDLTLGEDADGDGLPDAWQRLLRTLLGPGALIGPNEDADGDGISNLDEYLAGTYAFDPEDGFRLKLVPGADGTRLLQFMVIAPRTYTVYSSTNLQTWTPIEFKIPANGPTDPNRQRHTATDIRVIQVAPQVSPGTAGTKYFYKVLAQ